MNRLKLAAGVILVFLVGALAGSLGTGIYFKRHMGRFVAGGPPVPVRVRMLLDRFSNELDLSDAQRTEIEKVIRDSQEKIFALGRKIFPEIEEINEQSFTLIKDKLNSEQKRKLDVLHQKMEDLHDRFAARLAMSEKMLDHIVANMKDQLNLSREQETKVRTIMEAMAKERDKIMEKKKGQGPPGFPPLGPEMRELEKSVEKRLTDILTEKQMEKYRTLRKEGHFRIHPPPGGPRPFTKPPPGAPS